MSIWKAVLVGALIVAIGIFIDLYLLIYAERWAIDKVGQMGSVSATWLLLIPKFGYGLLIGYLASLVSRRSGSSIVLGAVLVGTAIFYCWKFFAVETWIAPEWLAYFMALGPYLAFFAGFAISALVVRRGRSNIGRASQA